MSGVLGIFLDEAARDAAAARLGPRAPAPTAVSPVPPHDDRPSPIRFFTLAGAIAGGAAGFGLSAYASTKWGMVVSAKPLVAIPPFLVVAFECAILFGALATALGVLLLAFLPSLFEHRGLPAWFDPRLTADRWGLFVPCAAAEAAAIERALSASGAEATRRIEAAP